MKSKNFDLVLFSSLFAGLLIFSNAIATTQVKMFGMLVTGSFISYPLTFAISNVINERLGIKEARKVVFSGLITMTVAVIITFIINYLASEAENMSILVYIASIISFAISQVINFTIYNGIRTNIAVKYLFSSAISLFIDAILFKSILMYFGVLNGEIFVEVMSHVLFGVLTILIVTPLFFIFCYNSKKKAN